MKAEAKAAKEVQSIRIQRTWKEENFRRKYLRVQPLEEKLKYPGRHLSHCLEVTPGLHRHCPSYLAQMLLIEPVELQAHAKIELIYVFEH